MEKQIILDYYKKAVLQSWLINNKSVQDFLQELLHSVKKELPEIQAIFLDPSKVSPWIIFFCEDKKAKQVVESFFKKSEEKISYKFHSLSDLQENNLEGLSPIHQLSDFLTKKQDKQK